MSLLITGTTWTLLQKKWSNLTSRYLIGENVWRLKGGSCSITFLTTDGLLSVCHSETFPEPSSFLCPSSQLCMSSPTSPILLRSPPTRCSTQRLSLWWVAEMSQVLPIIKDKLHTVMILWIGLVGFSSIIMSKRLDAEVVCYQIPKDRSIWFNFATAVLPAAFRGTKTGSYRSSSP